MSDVGRMVVACMCGLVLLIGFGSLFLAGPGLVQERTKAVLPSSPEQVEVEEVEEVEEVDNSARVTCFEHLRSVQEQGAELSMSICNLDEVTEYTSADGACKRHMLATGNVCGD